MAEKVKTKCPLCGDVLSAGGYEAEFSADIGATCFRLFYKPLNAEILRTPNGESQRNTNVYLFGNPILFPPNRIRGGRFVFRGKEYVLPVNEPQTCVIDCFHFVQKPEELGLIVLSGGESKTFYTRICIEKNDN